MINAVIQKEWYSLEQCEENPKSLFIFGDNLVRNGCGGQAQIRFAPNSVGVPTKLYPTMDEDSFFSDRAAELIEVEKALVKVKERCIKGGYNRLVFPADGLGTGLSEMDVRSPVIFEKMNYMIYMLFGIKY